MTAPAGSVIDVRRVMRLLRFAVIHRTPESELALAVIDQALRDACRKDYGPSARRQIRDGHLVPWVEQAGVEPDYFDRLCREAGLCFEEEVAA